VLAPLLITRDVLRRSSPDRTGRKGICPSPALLVRSNRDHTKCQWSSAGCTHTCFTPRVRVSREADVAHSNRTCRATSLWVAPPGISPSVPPPADFLWRLRWSKTVSEDFERHPLVARSHGGDHPPNLREDGRSVLRSSVRCSASRPCPTIESCDATTVGACARSGTRSIRTRGSV
jgi:hypothetical protein